jgi:hypothetical protein
MGITDPHAAMPAMPPANISTAAPPTDPAEPPSFPTFAQYHPSNFRFTLWYDIKYSPESRWTGVAIRKQAQHRTPKGVNHFTCNALERRVEPQLNNQNTRPKSEHATDSNHQKVHQT